MSQMRWFHKLSSIILIILAHYWDFELKRRVCVAHHCISDDLNKSNEQMTHCFDLSGTHLLHFLHIFATLCFFHNFAPFTFRNFYDQKNGRAVPAQPSAHCH